MTLNILRSVLRLGGGSLGAAVVQVASLPVLATLYGVDDFGEFAIANSLAAIAAAICIWRIDLLIATENTAQGRADALGIGLLLFFASVALVGGLALIWQAQLDSVLAFTHSIPMQLLVGLTCVQAVLQLSYSFFAAEQKYFAAGMIRMTTSIAVIASQLAFANAKGGLIIVENGLILGQLCGSFLAALICFAATIKPLWLSTKTLNLAKITRFVKSKKATILLSPITVAPNTMSKHLVQILSWWTAAPEIAGLFYFLERLVIYPCTLVGDLFWRVQHSSLAAQGFSERASYILTGAVFATVAVTIFLILEYAALILFEAQLQGLQAEFIVGSYGILCLFVVVRTFAVTQSFFIFFGLAFHQLIFDSILLALRSVGMIGAVFLISEDSLISSYLICGTLCYLGLALYWTKFFNKHL